VGDLAPGTVRVLTVDDQEIFRRAAGDLVAAADGFLEIAQAGSGEEALRVACELQPDLILLDVRMPGLGGIETARRLRTEVPAATVILMSLEELPEPLPDDGRQGRVPHVRKQELSVRKLKDLWRVHGRSVAARAVTPGAPSAPSRARSSRASGTSRP
jgi:CheY-like chemotaxis protein